VYVRLKRQKKSANPTVQVLESYRDGDKIKQRLITSLGVIKTEEDRTRLIHMGHALIAKLEAERAAQNPQTNFDMNEIDHEQFDHSGIKKTRVVQGEIPIYASNLNHVRTENCGFSDVFGKLSQQLGFDEVLKEADRSGEHTFSVSEIIRSIFIQRIQEPSSKRRALFHELEQKGHLAFELHQLYRAMDIFLPFAERIQEAAHFAASSLLGRKVECYFYDATTLYFESVATNELMDFGYGKDGKFNQTQILLCLLVTEEGIPVGYEIFSGKTAETKTLATALEKLSKRYVVAGSTVVGDRGILSQDNIAAANLNKMNFILGEKLRGLPKKYVDTILDISNYTAVGTNENPFMIREIPHPTRGEKVRLILGYSVDRAKKDKSDRERLLSKLKKRLAKKKKTAPKELISNRGVLKYVFATGGEVKLNLEAIAKDERWDGFFGIATDHPTLTPSGVIGQYRGLWQVEAQFRNYKHNLEARPIYHWTPDRIKTHVLTCFMSLCLERHLELILKKSGMALTSLNIHDALRRCENIIFQDKKSNRIFSMGSSKSVEAKQIYVALGLNSRSSTREICDLKAPVVPSLHSVKPQLSGIR
jgi:transposase